MRAQNIGHVQPTQAVKRFVVDALEAVRYARCTLGKFVGQHDPLLKLVGKTASAQHRDSMEVGPFGTRHTRSNHVRARSLPAG